MQRHTRSRSQGPLPEGLGRAATLCFEGKQNDEDVAAQLGVCRRTLARWKHRELFKTTTERLCDEWIERLHRRHVEQLLARMSRPVTKRQKR